jgi:dolichol-phosphate mannosyltransferase
MREVGLLSVVTPMHNEEGNARELYERIVAALGDLPFELIVTDDGSSDRTREILAGLAAADPRVKVIGLSRNFGHQAALTAGLDHARGDVVVMLDSDLQDPPEVIPDMVERWRQGSDVVYAVRGSRDGETRFKVITASWFYRLFKRLAQIEVPLDAGDFRLMDRRALDALLAMPERNRFLRGMTVWIGFTQSSVTYERAARGAGDTKYTLRRMLRLGLDATTSFSHVPLQLATLLGFFISALALVAVLLLGGIQLITVGIIGEYVGRIYDEVKNRPLYVVRSRRNLPEGDD